MPIAHLFLIILVSIGMFLEMALVIQFINNKPRKNNYRFIGHGTLTVSLLIYLCLYLAYGTAFYPFLATLKIYLNPTLSSYTLIQVMLGVGLISAFFSEGAYRYKKTHSI